MVTLLFTFLNKHPEFIILTGLSMFCFALAWVNRQQPPLKSIWAVFGMIALALALLLSWQSDPRMRLLWLLSLALPAIVGQRALLIALIRGREVSAFFSAAAEHSALPITDRSFVVPMRERADRYFGLLAIVLRFGAPALLLGFVCFCFGNVLFMRPESIVSTSKAPLPTYVLNLDANSLVHARLGLLGAYTYAVLLIGKRAVRNDITTGSVLWAAVALMVGPIAGALMPTLADAVGTPAGTKYHALAFLAGFSPQAATQFLDWATSRLFSNPAHVGTDSSALALTRLPGINKDLEQRLDEEGIYNAFQLAYHDPVVLMRNTPFSAREILAWVDAALLLVNAQDRYDVLQRVGIVSATALIHSQGNQKLLAKVAESTQMDIEFLTALVDRLASDPQARAIAVLNQSTAMVMQSPNANELQAVRAA